MFRVTRTPQQLLLCMMFLMSFGFATWMVLLNNFVVERAQFTGVEIGILQSVREIPGFLAFTAIFILLLIREQSFALLSLATMFIGILLTGFFPNALGLYITTVIMSVGFHYFETINKSLTLQWLDKKDTAEFMGQALSVKAVASLSAYGLIWLAMGQLGVDYVWVYALVGGLGIVATLAVMSYFNNFAQHATQHKKLILRQRYWLYYALVFLSGARRQIFIVFAGFMMVEKFGYSVSQISTLFIANYVFNFLFAKKIGAFIGRVGERRALIIEYVGLIVVFVSYALVDNANVAAGLYIIDHLFFAFAIAINTYFQKIADPRDIAASASVSFTINHIAAVVIPALLGIVWIYSQAAVFLIGAGFAVSSLLLAICIPTKPEAGREVAWARS
ncbi:MFS transporter [Neiella sp. HB171785]|uniref:MFS transporter n=1 Tax=Neiella litorisoli TaxID=2771431 RepID=A0A8J6QUE1_9GAMM|nr:MFS transporter [Neiella litorisoli]MBD1388873.1 MFS transporter [Neiella litorisoli]